MGQRERQSRRHRERGAAAVEFALVIPLFLAVLVGIVEFSNYLRIQISVSQAAREAARTMAISNDSAKATAAGRAGAPGLTSSMLSFTFTPTTCDPAAIPVQTVTALATYAPYKTLTGFSIPPFIPGISLPTSVKGTSAMRCGG